MTESERRGWVTCDNRMYSRILLVFSWGKTLKVLGRTRCERWSLYDALSCQIEQPYVAAMSYHIGLSILNPKRA